MDNQTKWLLNYLDNLEDDFKPMEQALDLLDDYIATDYSYESKNKRLREWNPDQIDLYVVVTKIFTGALLNPTGITYQALIGYVSPDIHCEDVLDTAKIAAECIALCYQADLIMISRISDKTMMITTEYEIDEDIPELDKHVPVFKRIEPVSRNQILGNKFKQHNLDICNEHINLLNNTKLCIEKRILDCDLEQSKHILEDPKEIEQWNMLMHRSERMYQHTLDMGNTFRLNHAYDTRGRCYCEGYYINYQGSSFKKALVQLANKEVVNLTN